MTTKQVGLEEARGKLGHLADEAHNEGAIIYLMRHGNEIAAIVPVGSRATAMPKSVLDAAMNAAWPGLPTGMKREEAKRRMVAALNAAYPHLADLLDKARKE